jgi:S-DNA-T family DNA segregation ATPase FtsK/SpoIIIE
VLGTSGSGKSVALATLAAGARAAGESAAVWLPRDPVAAWDVLADLLAQLESSGAERRLLVVDDADALVARVPAEHRTELLERLSRVLREGQASGITVALSAQRVSGELQSLVPLAPARLMLRHASRQDWVLAGGDGSAFHGELAPGGGAWLGARVQVASGARPRPDDPPPHRIAIEPDRPLAVVSTRASAVTARLAAAGYEVLALTGAPDPGAIGRGRVAVVGDVDDWQSRWGALAAVRPVAQVVLDGCTPADLRALTRSRELPPPLGRGDAWLLEPDGTVRRTALP